MKKRNVIILIIFSCLFLSFMGVNLVNAEFIRPETFISPDRTFKWSIWQIIHNEPNILNKGDYVTLTNRFLVEFQAIEVKNYSLVVNQYINYSLIPNTNTVEIDNNTLNFNREIINFTSASNVFDTIFIEVKILPLNDSNIAQFVTLQIGDTVMRFFHKTSWIVEEVNITQLDLIMRILISGVLPFVICVFVVMVLSKITISRIYRIGGFTENPTVFIGFFLASTITILFGAIQAPISVEIIIVGIGIMLYYIALALYSVDIDLHALLDYPNGKDKLISYVNVKGRIIQIEDSILSLIKRFLGKYKYFDIIGVFKKEFVGDINRITLADYLEIPSHYDFRVSFLKGIIGLLTAIVTLLIFDLLLAVILSSIVIIVIIVSSISYQEESYEIYPYPKASEAFITRAIQEEFAFGEIKLEIMGNMRLLSMKLEESFLEINTYLTKYRKRKFRFYSIIARRRIARSKMLHHDLLELQKVLNEFDRLFKAFNQLYNAFQTSQELAYSISEEFTQIKTLSRHYEVLQEQVILLKCNNKIEESKRLEVVINIVQELLDGTLNIKEREKDLLEKSRLIQPNKGSSV